MTNPDDMNGRKTEAPAAAGEPPPGLDVRPITGAQELDLFTRLPYVLDGELAGDLAGGRRRPEWMWVALRGDRLLARVAWWSRAGAQVPAHLDVFDIADGATDPDLLDVAEHLLRSARAAVLPAGAEPAEYSRFVPPTWQEDPAARQAAEDRMAVLARTGARLLVERLRLEWRPGAPVPAGSGRLAFRPVRDADEITSLMAEVLDGTLDAHSLADLATMTPREAAAEHYEGELARYTSPRQWWQVAALPGGEPVGFVLPARNDYNAIIAYIGVLPAHRGHGYIDDLLAEGTRILAAQDVPRIRASTDVGNIPMARAFARAGYADFERTLTMVWS
ncbi:Acetyltransferase (GNAT) family protein [Actinacidiphila bryophytorum]|uniref:Acetyltransferase (GNAT) family protein n=2 Tax=Actinacidiphila bryophytorum TaxID=1436133 RepID=A0A9W4H7F5_9ACTN|nr:Acetyltransferase (GNAT) family protein [Actinacidiphila bryophytorum]